MTADIRNTKILRRIPEFLLKRADPIPEDATEPLELLEPNTINVVAALLDVVNEDLGGLEQFNTWSDFEQYIGEFRLDEVFEGLDAGFYNVSDPELLKGFFSFKGTEIDLQYLLKIAGFTIVIYDSSYFSQAESMYDLLISRPGGFEEEIAEILAAFSQPEIDEGFAKLEPHQVNNVTPLVSNPNAYLFVINVSTSIEDFLATEGVVLSPEALDYVTSLYLIYIDSFYYDDKTECDIVSELYVDLDSPNFVGFKPTKVNSVLRAILKTRITPCAYLKSNTAYLETKDYYSAPARVSDQMTLAVTQTLVENITHVDEEGFQLRVGMVEPYTILETEGNVMTNVRNDYVYQVDNVNVLKVKGDNDHPWIEETVEVAKTLKIQAFPAWTPVNDGTGNVNPTSFPAVRKGMTFEAKGMAIPLNSTAGVIQNKSIVKFAFNGSLESVSTIPNWVPANDGSGNVSPASYPVAVNAFVRVAGVASTLYSSALGASIKNNDIVYFNSYNQLTLTILV